MVIAHVDVDTDRPATFAAFTDPEIYSRWMGVPVRIDNGRFSCTMEWGTQIVGVYEIVVAPSSSRCGGTSTTTTSRSPAAG